MNPNESFARRVDALLDSAADRASPQTELDAQMAAEDQSRRSFQRRANELKERVLQPLLEEVVSRFPNASLSWKDSLGTIHALCEFAHTKEMPSTTTLELLLTPVDSYRGLRAAYRLLILPVFMEYTRSVEQEWPVSEVDEPLLGAWVEERLLEFVATYVRIRTHSGYHHAQLVTDPVCKMTFARGAAAARLEDGPNTYFFCSLPCRDAFLRDRNRGASLPKA